MEKQLTVSDILNSKEIYLYTYNDTIYVIDEKDNAYGFSEGCTGWYRKDNFWDYFESETMLYYLRILTKEEAVELYLKWSVSSKIDELR